MDNMIVGRFSKALLGSDYDRWNLEVQAEMCAVAVALRTPEQRLVEEA